MKRMSMCLPSLSVKSWHPLASFQLAKLLQTSCIRRCAWQLKNVICPFITEMFNKCVQVGGVPQAWKGAHLVPVPKKSSLAFTPQAFRPVVLSMNECKLFERVIKARLEQYLSTDSMQYGHGHAVGCDLVTFTYQQITAELTRQRRSYAVLFLDVKGAFDNIVRQLLWSRDKRQAQLAIQQICLTSSVAEVLANAINDSPALLVQDGVPQKLIDVIESLYFADWLRPGPHTGGCGLQPLRGTRQGGCLSGALWCRYQAQLNAKLHAAVLRLGLCLRLRLPASRSFVQDVDNDSTLCLPPTVYLDDVSCILIAVTDVQLLRGIAALTPVVYQDYADLALSLNYKPYKTCVRVHMAGKQKGSLKQMLVKVAHDHGLEGIEQEITVRLAKAYDAISFIGQS
eukprot:6473530-Amphidinium_carterae.4